jgi:eukaryotic translation initiation factor 2C
VSFKSILVDDMLTRPIALKDRPFTIKDFMYETAANMMIKIRNDKGEEEEVFLKDYFERKYDHIIPNPHLPVVEMTKKGVYYPMDCCVILPAQKYPFKLTETQTANMIKFAVTRPPVRAQHIKEVLDKINWAQDRYLKHYGLSVSKNMLECRARLLTAPIVQFAGNKTVKPGTSGRWRIDGTQFLTPNKDVLTSWGVICVNDIGRDKLNEENVQHFVRVFINTYKGHGGKVTNYNPITEFCNAKDIATVISEMFNKISNKTGRAQLMMVMVSGKDAFVYNRIKKSLDCRWGVVSQVVLNFHAKKAAPQYVSNVCLKINAKLGGSTARVVNLVCYSPLANYRNC